MPSVASYRAGVFGQSIGAVPALFQSIITLRSSFALDLAQASWSRSAEVDKGPLLVAIILSDFFDCEFEDEACLFMIAGADTLECTCRYTLGREMKNHTRLE